MQEVKDQQQYKHITSSVMLNKQFSFLSVIGKGSFGKIFKIYSKRRNQEAALKIQENKYSKGLFLKNEHEKLQILKGITGIPQVFSFGQYEGGFFMEMQLLEQDLSNSKIYSLSQITHLTIDLLTILDQVHNKGVIHQDIKPQNIMKSKDKKYYLIDYGLSKIQSKNDRHKLIKSFIGTPRYASVAAHQRKSQTKKDDLESLFYNIAYLYYRKLPWSKINIENISKLQKIRLMKVYSKDKLFQQMGINFSKAFLYFNSLQSIQKPNYKVLIGYFKRHKSIIQKSLIPHDFDRNHNKKYSLRVTNFLQVPQNPYKPKHLRSGSNGKDSVGTNNSFSSNSDIILNHLLCPKQILQLSVQQGSNIDQQDEPTILKIKNVPCNFYMKNPFNIKV